MDLNLLTALDALLEEESVQAAADRLRLSPPAMSRTLGRIRRATGDEILVRTGRSMVPTSRALALRDEVRELVRRAEDVLNRGDELDLGTLERTFTVQGHETLLSAIAPGLLARVTAEAPGVRVRMLAEAPVDTPDLARGHLDLVVGAAPDASPDIRIETVGDDHLVVALRAGHPALAGELTPERYAAADHVIVSRRGRLRDRVDDLLAARGLRRRVVASLPTGAAALHLAAGSDVLVCVTARASAPMIEALGLRTLPVPVVLDPSAATLAWHRRQDSDPGHRWLRAHVAAVMGDLEGDRASGSGPASAP